MKDLLKILKYLKYLPFLPILNLVLVTDLVVQKLTPSKIIKGHCGSAVKQLQIQNYGQKNTTFEKVQNKGVVIARARAEKRWHLRCSLPLRVHSGLLLHHLPRTSYQKIGQIFDFRLQNN